MTGAAAAGPARVRWVVDPLDGTVNYLYGLHDWAVSIAAEVDGTVVAGVVEVPRHGETFTAVAGQGAWLHRGEARVALHCNLRRTARPGSGGDWVRVRFWTPPGAG